MSDSSPLHVVILAAGRGKRMASERPKVLHRLGGRSMLAHVLETASELEPTAIHVVVGHGAETVRGAFPDAPVTWVEQVPQGGTGHAVLLALGGIPDTARVLVLLGDVPLVPTAALISLLHDTGPDLGLLTAVVDDPTGYGRIVRDPLAPHPCTGIVEHADASPGQRRIQEINTGLLVAGAAALGSWLSRCRADNVQGEIYLTDVVTCAVADGVTVHARTVADAVDVLGINDRVQLARAERRLQFLCAQRLLEAGVTLLDPERFDLRGSLDCGQDVEIDINCVFEGLVRIGDGCRIGPGCILRDAVLEPGVVIEAYSHLDGVRVGARAVVGPYARLRPGAELGADTRIGNFVEIKQSRLEPGSKVNHLSYIGDASIGQGVNVGAGTITCNYDGRNKHRTRIDDGAFIGSNTELVAPVHVGAGATVAAGTTVTGDVPAGSLAISRVPQTVVKDWRGRR